MKLHQAKNGRIEVQFEATGLLKFMYHISEVNNIATAIFHLTKTGDLNNINPLDTDGLAFTFSDEHGNTKATHDQIYNWVFKKAFEDFIVGLTQSLIEGYILLKTAALSSLYNSTVFPDATVLQSELDAISSKAYKLNFPTLIEKIEEMIGGQLPLKDEILSINQVRNCLVHKNATVTESSSLNLKFKKMHIRVQKDGQMLDLTKSIKSQRFRAEKLEVEQVSATLTFRHGELLVLTPDIFKDVTYTCILFVNELIYKLPLPQSIKDQIVNPFSIKLATE